MRRGILNLTPKSSYPWSRLAQVGRVFKAIGNPIEENYEPSLDPRKSSSTPQQGSNRIRIDIHMTE